MTTPLVDPGLSVEEGEARCRQAGGAGAGIDRPVVRAALAAWPAPASAAGPAGAPGASPAALRVGPYAVDAGAPSGDGWRAARRTDGEGGPALRARVAEGPAAAAALRALARRWARVAERAAAAPAVEALLAHGAATGGDAAVLVVHAPRGAPLEAPAPLAVAVEVAAALAQLDDALRAAGAFVEVGLADVRHDAARADGPRTQVAGLERLRDPLGVDPRRGTVAWGALVAALLGVPRADGAWDLEAAPPCPPALLAAVRAALAGEGAPLPLLRAALDLGAPAAAPDPRRGAGAGRAAGLTWPTEGDPLLLLADLPADAGGAADADAGAGSRLALDLGLDRLARVEHAVHGGPPATGAAAAAALAAAAHAADAVDVDAALARRAAFAAAAGARAAACGGRLLVAPALDPALAAAPAAVLRRGEPLLVAPAPAPPAPAPALDEAGPAPRVTALLGADGAAALAVEGLTGPAVAVRARPGVPLLVPADGDVVATLTPDAEGRAAATDAAPGARYAVFPLAGPRALAPGRARARAAVDVEALAARPRIGAIEVAWTAPAGARVVLRGGPRPLAGPADGELLAYTQHQLSFVHDCLDAGQEVHYRAFAVDPRGGLTPGAAASAVALGPPPALGPVKAAGGNREVTLTWAWPEGASYDRVRVARSPAWPEGEREVPRAAPPLLVDAGCPAGQALTYTLRTALGPTVSRRESTAAAKAVLELARFEARPGGRAVLLELELPEGAPPGTSVEVVRNTERVPQDGQDGGFVRIGKATRYVDEPLPAGAPVHYRACLVVDGTRSPGVTASATPVERAGQVSGVEVVGAACALEVRFQPPTERCDEVRLEAGPQGGALEPVPYDAAAVRGGAPARVPCPPGAPWVVRLVPVFQGNADATQAVERAAVAWDAPKDLVGRSAGGKVELAWTPPAAPPRAWRLRRTIKGGKADDPGVELAVAPDAAALVDADVQTRRTYVYALSARWGPEGAETETPPLVAEVPVHAEPAALERPEVRSTGGAVLVAWLPCPPKDRVRWDATTVYASARPAAELQAAFAARPSFLADEAAGLGLEERESRKKATTREQVRLAAPPEGQVHTVVVASACGPARRVGLVAPALGLPEGFLALTPDTSQGVPGVTWSLPAWVARPDGPARLVKLAIVRGLEDAQVEGLDPAELEALSRPFRAELEVGATRYLDQEALPFVTWSYAVEATFDVGGVPLEVHGPRATVPRCAGGTLAPKAEQARGLFGRAKHAVGVRIELEGGSAAVWPPFKLVRGIAGQTGGKAVLTFPGGPPPPPWSDEDLGNFTKGMTLVYRVELERARDKLGFTGGEAKVVLA